MKILSIVTAFKRHEDDVHTPWLVEAIKHLKARGHEVEVLTSSYRGLGSQIVNGIRVWRYRYFPKRWERLTHEETVPDRIRRHPVYLVMVPSYVILGMIKAAWLARKYRYDIIHVHWPLPHTLIGYAAKLACGAKMVSTFHGVSITWVKAQLKFLKFFLRWTLRVSEVVTVNSSFTAAQVASIGKANVHIIPFGTGLASGEEEQQKDEAPRAPEKGGPKRILFVGRFVERKGIPYLLEALARVKHKLDVRADIVGDGPIRGALEKLARELSVESITTFPGFVSQDELRRLFRETDLFVLPAIIDRMGCTEGLGVVLIEAMIYGKPVVASRVGGIPDVVVDGVTGKLVTPASADALADAVVEVLSNPDLAKTMGEHGRRRVQEVFSWDAIASKMHDVYCSLQNVRKNEAKKNG